MDKNKVDRYLFVHKDKLILKYVDSLCPECGRNMVSVTEKIWWIFKEHHGDYCVNPKCPNGDRNYDLLELLNR